MNYRQRHAWQCESRRSHTRIDESNEDEMNVSSNGDTASEFILEKLIVRKISNVTTVYN